jgi:RimJ/RimL family protein N-acetyltransferase
VAAYLKGSAASVKPKEFPVSDDLNNWQPRPRPERKTMEGRYVRLEPLDAKKHGDGLHEASTVPDADQRFAWLFESPPQSRAEFDAWLAKVEASQDPVYYAVMDKASGRVAGRQTLMRIDQNHGVIEIGSIYWGPLISRKPAATEAQYLFARHVFDDLGYRRYEWKCHNDNGPSKRAAERFGFTYEGLFRQHMIAKGGNRDTAWYSIIDKEWPALKKAYESWLEPSNFDGEGVQEKRLEDFRK